MISRHELINFKLCLDVKYKHQENVTLRNLENFENLAAEHCRKTQFFLVFAIYRILWSVWILVEQNYLFIHQYFLWIYLNCTCCVFWGYTFLYPPGRYVPVNILNIDKWTLSVTHVHALRA